MWIMHNQKLLLQFYLFLFTSIRLLFCYLLYTINIIQGSYIRLAHNINIKPEAFEIDKQLYKTIPLLPTVLSHFAKIPQNILNNPSFSNIVVLL